MATPTDTRRGDSGAPRRRRRLPVLAVLVFLIVAGGVGVSIHPYTTYREVKSEQTALEAQVAVLEQENGTVQAQIDRLEHDSYLETLARSELSLARPGEDVFIVTGADTIITEAAGTSTAPEPGPLEKMLSSLRRLF